jgi:hypothetical protein
MKNEIETAVRARLSARRPVEVQSLARELGVSSSDVGRALSTWTRDRDFGFCGVDGSPNGHTHVKFLGEIFAR